MEKLHMKFYVKYRLFIAVIGIGVLIAIGCIWGRGRIKMLIDYRRLLADVEIMERLAWLPDIKQLKTKDSDSDVFVGYATFSFPFGQLKSIDSEFQKVTIRSEHTLMTLSSLSFHEAFEKGDREINLVYSLTYEGGKVKAKESNKYDKYDELLMGIQRDHPFEFDKTLYTAQPKHFLSLLLMPFEDLYVYVKMLEIKNQSLKRWDVSLFETDFINGLIERPRADSAYALIVIYELNQRFMQAVAVKSKDTLEDEEIERFIASFRYHIDTIESRHNELPDIITEATADIGKTDN